MENALFVVWRESVEAILDETATPVEGMGTHSSHRSRPSGLVVLVFLINWALAFWWLRRTA